MNRYAPELAVVTGGLLAASLGGFILFSLGELYSAIVASAVVAYPFAAYAAHTSRDPTAVLPPRLVGALAALAAAIVVIDVFRLFPPTVRTALFGLLLALVVFLPVAAYGVRYGAVPASVPAAPGAAVTTFAAIGILLAGVVAAPVYAATTSLLIFLAGAVFADARGGLSRRRRRQLPLAGLCAASGLVVIGIVAGGPLDPWVFGAAVAAFGPLVFYGLTAELAGSASQSES